MEKCTELVLLLIDKYSKAAKLIGEAFGFFTRAKRFVRTYLRGYRFFFETLFY